MTGEHVAHLAAGALLAAAGAIEAAAAAAAHDVARARRAAAALGLGWLTMRYGALHARVRRLEVATGAWQHLAPELAARARPGGPATPSPVAGPPGHNPACSCGPWPPDVDHRAPWSTWPSWPTGR